MACQNCVLKTDVLAAEAVIDIASDDRICFTVDTFGIIESWVD
jgi:hypothetical protein